MKSIQNKFAGIIAVSLSVLALAIGVCLFVAVGKLSREDSATIITMKCQEVTDDVNSRLSLISRGVEIVTSYASNYVEDVNDFKNTAYVEKYVNDVLASSKNVATIMGASTQFFFRVSPDLTDGKTTGFYIQIKPDEAGYTKCPMTSLPAYPRDSKNVEWYYRPMEEKKGVWLEPHFDSRANMDLISYVCPIYVDDTFIGVFGMEVDFTAIVEYAESIVLYNNGFASMVGRDTQLVYYKQKSGRVMTDRVPDKFFSVISSMDRQGELLEYKSDIGRVKVAYGFLDNNMILLVIVRTADINSTRNALIYEALAITLLTLLVTILSSFATSRKIIRPLKALTKAAQSYAEGNWDVEVKCDTKDEVKLLTDSVTKMARATQSYIARVNLMAYQDGLTGLKNKASFIEYSDRIRRNEGGNWNQYGIVVFDVNYLKETNDNFGHETGDKLINFSAHYICDVFRHSPVFRIGGDEFIALLYGKDYENREPLLAFFRENAKQMVVDREKDIVLSIASGMAAYPEMGTDFDEVFEAADSAMYKNKVELKNNRE